MNKRIKKKKLNQLSEEEQTVIKLFRECESVSFYKYRESVDSARQFTSILNQPTISESGNTIWFQSEKHKISAAAFLKGG